jgi:hypothetical protein
MSARTHENLVADQFGPRAAAYVESAVHAQGKDLVRLAEIVRGHGEARALDMGCGGGHVSSGKRLQRPQPVQTRVCCALVKTKNLKLWPSAAWRTSTTLPLLCQHRPLDLGASA